MADSPDPSTPHQHLYHPNLLARARGRGPSEAAQVGVVGCILCGETLAIKPAARCGAGHPWAWQTSGGEVQEVAAPVGIERVEVVGHVEGAWATSQRGTWRVSIGGRIVFARQSDGCAQALRAAARAGDQVRVDARRIRADLWAGTVHWGGQSG